MGAALRQWRSATADLGTLAMPSDCVVEARYWSSGTQILCRVNHSHMARIREAKGLMELPTRNVCLLNAAHPADLDHADCHYDAGRRVHVHDLGAGRAARPAAAFAFPGPLAAGPLALAR